MTLHEKIDNIRVTLDFGVSYISENPPNSWYKQISVKCIRMHQIQPV